MDLLKTIECLQSEKQSKHIKPDHVLIPELLNKVRSEVLNELNSLYKDGKIGVIETLNSKAVYIKPK